ncbi:MAG TPA: NAD(P)H-dependent oxidoreductase [Dongiaceae bacterium]|nr:NAD(P)H-dependent oxidoreductase [Dongiaceae bacterium]
MPNILVVTGSVRPNSVNQKVVPLVVAEAEAQGATVTVANLQEINLPFYDAPMPPTAPDFAPPHESVQRWTDMVAEADGVILVTPEYNHAMSPIQLNAVDWIGKEWNGKPVEMVGYGWTSGGGQAHAAARESLAVNLKAKVGDAQTNLFLGKDLNPDGTVADETVVHDKIATTVKELLASI